MARHSTVAAVNKLSFVRNLVIVAIGGPLVIWCALAGYYGVACPTVGDGMSWAAFLTMLGPLFASALIIHGGSGIEWVLVSLLLLVVFALPLCLAAYALGAHRLRRILKGLAYVCLTAALAGCGIAIAIQADDTCTLSIIR